VGVSGDDAHCYAGCEDVEKGCFASARHALRMLVEFTKEL
jgi:hypothetical protein